MRTFLMTATILAFSTPAFADCVHGTYPDGSEITVCAGGERSGRDTSNTVHVTFVGPASDVHDEKGNVTGQTPGKVNHAGNEGPVPE